ncbi:hypothetical protein [Mycolicibacterium celeriflavum]|uniref:Uncharacterized protein n=1 Tax=Mycolicibacterium celeriflavum TaxID=1249101 RepID=A0A7I7RMG9_MYCCF|nr:hypothetical protein [Mycolicibacterium celeriflavum]MCV7236931.1 hypothetical protein [Mycolicibacterium celeriflavum]BBY45500.1 hypothetical protein MCEL_37950 [Mycolicibacterium celeriflavum]
MTDAQRKPSGFWSRLSRRGKIVIVVDLVVLALLVAAAAIYFTMSRSDSSASDVSSAFPTTTSTSRSPLQTSYGLAWIVAACGGAMTLQDLPESPLPRAEDYVVCLAPESGASMVIGVYDDGAALNDDVAEMRTAHRYATRVDDTEKHWLVLVEGDSAAPLQPLHRYGFRIR